MTAFLIVEDEPVTRQYLAELLRDEFPEAQLDAASNLADALALARERRRQGDLYDVALLDVKLPADGTGGPPDLFPEQRRQLLAALGHLTVVVNHSAHADEERVRRLVADLREPNAPLPVLVAATPGSRWHEEVLRLTRRAVYTRRVADGLDHMREAARRGARGRSGPGPGGTQAVGALLRDIKYHWEDLEPELQQRVLLEFEVTQVGNEVLVGL